MGKKYSFENATNDKEFNLNEIEERRKQGKYGTF